MARCEWCDRDECKKVETWAAFVACNCTIDISNPCAHQAAAHDANVACELHRVNWRERALAAESRERWTSIVDRIPDNGEIVEGFTADNTVVTVWVERGRLEQEDGSLYPDGFITHYRPLPAPPEQ